MFSDFGGVDFDEKAPRKFSQDSSSYIKNNRVKFLIDQEPRRFTIDNTFKYKRQPKENPIENVTSKLAKLFRRKSSLTEKVPRKSSKVNRNETISEKTERIKVLLNQKDGRPRSNSEQQYSIMKKDTSFGPLTVLGLIEHNSINILENILDHFTCYDAMPCYSLMVAVDFNLTLYKTLEIFVQHNKTEICVWDSKSKSYIGCIRLHDILRYVFADIKSLTKRFNMKLSECAFFEDQNKNETQFGGMTFTEPSSNLKEGAQMLANSEKEQIYMLDCDNGNILKGLSSPEILKFIANQVSKFGMRMNDGTVTLESIFQPLNSNEFVHSNSIIKDALHKFIETPLVLVFAESSCQTFLTTFTCMDVAAFFVDVSLDGVEGFMDRQLWSILDFRRKIKTSKFYSCHSQTHVASACESMLSSKSDGILVCNRGRPVGVVTPKQILKSFVCNKKLQKDSNEEKEVFRM